MIFGYPAASAVLPNHIACSSSGNYGDLGWYDRPTDSASRQRTLAISTSPELRVRATEELEAILRELAEPKPDLVSLSMRARQAFAELNATNALNHLNRELGGYSSSHSVPYYRVVPAQYRWETDDTLAATTSVLTPAARPPPNRWERYLLKMGLSRLPMVAQHGTKDFTGKKMDIRYRDDRPAAEWRETVIIIPETYAGVLESYRNDLHDLIGQWVIALFTGAEAGHPWDMLRSGAEELATRAGIAEDLRSVVSDALGSDRSAWEGALMRCRNIMNKLSKYLYQAPRSTYPWITSGKGSPMQVDGDHYRNRLLAYLHQHGSSSDNIGLAQSHLDWFAGFAAEVNALGSEGKYSVSQRDVATGVMHLYLLLNEIAARTDGEPLHQIQQPTTASN